MHTTRTTTRLFVLASAVAAAACTSETGSSSGTSAPAPEKAMFDVPAGNATPNQVLGVWQSADQKAGDVTATTRWEVRDNRVILGMKCVSPTATEIVGGQVSATVSPTAIDVKEPKTASKQLGQVVCGVQITAGRLPACDAAAAESTYTVCFLVKDKALTIYQGGPTKKQEFTKVAD